MRFALALRRHLPTGAFPFALSALVHLAVFWQYRPSPPSSPLPVGYWVESVPSAEFFPQRRSLTKRAVPKSLALPTEESAPTAPPAAADPPAARLGNTEKATGLSGPIGDLNGVEVSVRQRYLYELEAFLNQNKPYPARARYLGQSGHVEMGFHLQADGRISEPHVVRPCIHDLLNQAALELVASKGRFRPIPPELKVSALHLTVSIQYELN